MRLSFLLLFVLLLSSCVKYREIRNFTEGSPFTTQPLGPLQPIRLQPDDLIAVSVQTVDPAVSAPFNFGGISTSTNSAGGINSNASNAQTAQNGGGQSYLIDQNGEINFPVLGRVKVSGLTTLQARDTITAHLQKFLTDPIINVRLLNFRFTVLGEVARPGSYRVEGERISVIEALGLAGDVSNFGNRENILIIRERNNERTYEYINLQSRDVFNSPYFYLAQNDVIYVDPRRSRLGATPDEATKYIQFTLPIVGILTLIATLIR